MVLSGPVCLKVLCRMMFLSRSALGFRDVLFLFFVFCVNTVNFFNSLAFILLHGASATLFSNTIALAPNLVLQRSSAYLGSPFSFYVGSTSIVYFICLSVALGCLSVLNYEDCRSSIDYLYNYFATLLFFLAPSGGAAAAVPTEL